MAPKLAFTAMGAGAGGMNGAIIGYSIGKGTYTAGKNIVDNVVAKRDEKTVVRIQTGIGFFDHMLTLFAFHSEMDIKMIYMLQQQDMKE